MFEARKQATAFPREVLDRFDRYVHGIIDRRAFLDSAAKVAGAAGAAAMLESLRPTYAWAQQVPANDADPR
jgi:carboxymethylenebutenolidase